MSDQNRNHESDSEDEQQKKQSPKSSPISTEDLLAQLMPEEFGEDPAYRSIGMCEVRPQGADLGVRAMGDFWENPINAYVPMQEQKQEIASQEEFDIPMKLQFETGLEDGPSQMMEESYDGEELGYLEPDEFQKSTAVISTQSAENVLNAVQGALAIMQSKGREVVYENEGYAFDVNFTHENKSCELEILLLETPDEHTAPGNIAILYNKLNGNGFTFQRFYRESVATTANDLGLELRALNGGHLPTMQVMTDEFQSESSEKHVADSMKLTLETIVKIIKNGSFAEPLREVTATLLGMASQYPNQVLEFCVKNDALVMNLQTLLRTHFNEPVVSKNILRFFNSILTKCGVFKCYPVCQQIVASKLFDYGVKTGLYWSIQKSEKVQTAKLICEESAKFVKAMADCYFSQGTKASPTVKALISKIKSNSLKEYGEFRTTMSSLLPRLN